MKSVSRRNTPQRGTRRSTRASKQSESSDIDDVPKDSPVTKATDHKSTENKSAKRGRNFSPESDSKRQRVSSGNESVSDDKETDKEVCSVGFWILDITGVFFRMIEFVFCYIIEYFRGHLLSVINNLYDVSFDYFQEAEFVEMGGTLDYREELAKQLKEDMAGSK